MLHKRHKEESKTIWQGNIALCPSNRDNHSAKAGNAKYDIKHWLKITCVSPEFPPKTSQLVISKMLEALNLKK